MKNNNICSICGTKPSDYPTRNLCRGCADRQAKLYYMKKTSDMVWPGDTPVTEDIHEADTTLDGVEPIPTTADTAQETDGQVWLRWDACSRAGHVGLKTIDGECWFCAKGMDTTLLNPSPRQQAIADGERWYEPTTPCPRCNTAAMRRVTDGVCQNCDSTKKARTKIASPRQQAIANGETWYTPTEDCPHCLTKALRHVDNGRCKGCQALRKPPRQQTDSQAFMRNNPDTVISRDDARLLGLRVYRTGDYCRKGHQGFRYTTTGACVDCAEELRC